MASQLDEIVGPFSQWKLAGASSSMSTDAIMSDYGSSMTVAT